MKSNTPFAAIALLAATSALASLEPPPPAELTGWQVRGPSGEPPFVSGPAPAALSAQPPLPEELVADALSLSGQAPSGMEPLSISLGLSTLLPTDSYELIAETARGLQCGYTWLQCYLFVRDNIRYTPYKGLSRGPVRTLLDREGSDADQAFLLLALLRASGFTATVCYSGRCDYPNDDYYDFFMPLGGATNSYDAEHWLGVSSDGTAYGSAMAVFHALQSSGVPFSILVGATPQASYLFKEHFSVYLYYVEGGLYLDPSFKPSRVTPPSASLAEDMGYARSSLLAAAGGVTNGWSVQGLSAGGLSNELGRLSANLAAAWRGAGADSATRDLVGGDEIVPQNLMYDQYVFHGYFLIDGPYDFPSMWNRNSFRAGLAVEHGTVTNNFWLDELGSRTLWISYTSDTSNAYPRALINLDGSNIASEVAGSSEPDLQAVVAVNHPAIAQWSGGAYPVTRAVTNVYVVPVGFGSPRRGGMRELTADRLMRLQGERLPEDDGRARAAVLHSLGQQWLCQCALLNTLYGRLGGYTRHSFFETGIVGQDKASYFDFKTGYEYTSQTGMSAFYGGKIFTSALEHGVLDQCNGPSRPAVSTVRILGLANGCGDPVYLASSSNWATVESGLTNYSSELLVYPGGNILQGQKYLLPKDGLMTFGQWSGTGFFSYGPLGSGSLISGGLGGGSPIFPGLTALNDVLNNMMSSWQPDMTVRETHSSDPVDMFSGAAIIDRTDLALTGPSPLAWRRHYDSRQRGIDGPSGRGWSHGYGSRLTVNANPDAFLGGGASAACAASAVACSAVDDLLSGEESALNLTVACLVADWWAAQLTRGAATVTSDARSLSFVRLPDGSYEPAPGVTASLSRHEDGRLILQERLGRSLAFATNGLLSRIEDVSGNSVSLSYSDGTALSSVSNSFGARIDLSWSGGRVESVSDTAGRTVRYAYRPDGCLTGVTDTAGHAWKFAYDSEGACLSETDPAGVPTVRNAYNGIGQVTNQFSAAGQSWVFAYADGTRSWEADPFGFRNYYGFTADGRQAWVSDRNDHARFSYYDGRGHMVTNIDALGRMNVNVFDASNRLVRVTEAANTAEARTTAFAYDSRHRLVAVTNALGRVTRMTYDACDRLESLTAPDGVAVANAYDSLGLVTSVRTLDALGRTVKETSSVYGSRGLATEVTSTDAVTTLFGYDNAGNVTEVTDARGHTARIRYDSRGLPTTTVDALGNSYSRLYTAAGRLAAAADPLGHAGTFLWTPGGKPSAMIRADGGVSTNEYDIADRLAAVRDSRGSRVAFGLDVVGRVTNRTASAWSDFTRYDTAGRITARVDSAGGLTVITNDWVDRPVAVTDPLGKSWRTAYDPLNAVTNTVDPRSRSTVYMRDAMGRLAVTRYPSGRTEGNGYDALGRTVAFTNAEGRVYRMGYDAQGRLLAATNAAGEQVFRNLYDFCGNLTNHVDGAGRAARYQYDAINRRTGASYADGAWEGFGYDAAGNLTASSNNVSRLSFTYDSMNRLASTETRVAGQAFTVGYGYDRGGLVTNVVYPDGKRVSYGYDADGRVTGVTDWANRTFTFTRDAAGRLNALSYPNGVTGSWTHDANHKVSSWSYTKGVPVASRTITRDDAGIKTGEHVTAGLFPNPQSPRRAANTFDAADRLVSATVAVGTNTIAETYRYDGGGALTNVTRGAETQNYEYDFAGRLTFAHVPGVSLAVTYDTLGNRLSTYSGGAVRLWVTDHADPLKRPLMEMDANGEPVRYYVWGGGLLLAVVEADGVIRYAHSDDQGSVVAITDSNGTVTDQYCNGPYGADWGHTGTNSIPFRWLGSQGVFKVGGSALHLTRYRAYDTYTGRFLSSDPLGLGGGPNLYAYCLGNPLAYIDPLGLGAEATWYDQLASYMAGQVATSKDIVNGSSMPWLLAGSINTAMDLGLGVASYPSAFMHMGEAAGRYSFDPSLENLAGVYSDIALGAGTAAAVLSFVPSANVPLGTTTTTLRPQSPPASAPVGQSGTPLGNAPYLTVPRNPPGTVNGFSYSGHAFDQMQNRGIPPSVVENTINVGQTFPGSTPNTTGYYDPVNNIRVIQNNQTGNIVTVIPGAP